MKMTSKTVVYGLILIITVATVSAARVGVVVDDGAGGITQKCYDVEDGSKAEFVCNQAGFECDGPGLYGYAICKIGSTGCPADKCFCDTPFWGFSTKSTKDKEWDFSDNAGVSYVEIEDQMMLGFRWGGWLETPTANPSFCDVCECGGGGKGVHIPRILGYTILPQTPYPKGMITLELKDNKTQKPVRDAVVDVYGGVVGVTNPLFSGTSDKNGTVQFTIEDEGQYLISITGIQYPHEYIDLNVTATTTTTTSTTTTTFVSTTTTYPLPSHFIGKATTTTQTTTTLEEPKIIGAVTAPRQQEPQGGLIDGLINWLRGLIA